MIIKPIKQKNLFDLNRYFIEIANLYNNNKLPNKILLTGPKGSGKSTLAYHLINYVFSINEDFPYDIKLNEINIQNNSFKLIKNGTHPNFHLILTMLIYIFDDNNAHNVKILVFLCS